MRMEASRLFWPELTPTLKRRVPLPSTVLKPVIHGAVVVPVQEQSVREAVTTMLPEPPPEPKLTIGEASLKLQGCPPGFTTKGEPGVVPLPVTTTTVTV